MTEIFGVPIQAFLGQLLIGLINGSFYAMLSLGLAIIFGLIKVINFAHGAQYMMGAFAGYLVLAVLGIGYWPALILAPLIVGLVGAVVERLALSRLYNLDHLYGLLFTFGLALALEGAFRYYYGSSGQPYAAMTPVERSERFQQFLVSEYAAGRRVVLIVDEAQNLSPGAVEALRMLSNINADKDQLLQVVLVGQPELKALLNRPELHQFAQRVGVDFFIPPLAPAERAVSRCG